jgi:tetratricopeptide (TPR) repeat protein
MSFTGQSPSFSLEEHFHYLDERQAYDISQSRSNSLPNPSPLDQPMPSSPEPDAHIDLTQNEYSHIPRKEIPMFEKEQGCSHYTKGNSQLAIKCFNKAILALRYLVSHNEVSSDEIATVYLQKIIIPCNLNMGLCHYNTERYEGCITFCNQVLKVDKSNIKALLRRAKSNIK